MSYFPTLIGFLGLLFLPANLRGQGASFGGKKVTKAVDFRSGGITTLFGNYSTISKVQIAGDQVIFSAYGGANLDQIAILSADGATVVPLLELGRDSLADDYSLRLGDFRYLGEVVPLRIPVIVQEQNEHPRLMFLNEGTLTEVAGPTTTVPGTSDDRFTQFLGVAAYGDEIAFIGVTTAGMRGVYLASGGSVRELADTVTQGVQLPGKGVQNRLVFDGTTVYFLYQSSTEGAPKDLYGATLNGEPFLVVYGEGEVTDAGVARSYQTSEALAGKTDELTFLAEIDGDSNQSQWAFLQASDSGLKVVARSASLSPMDGRSIAMSDSWDSFFDGEAAYVGGVNQVLGELSEPALSPTLDVFAGSPPMSLVDIESGKAALLEASPTPKRIWADLGIVGPVEIPVPPEPQVVPPGATASFEVVAEGLEPFTYQWFLNGEPLASTNSPQLQIPKITFEKVGEVTVKVSNSIDSQTVTTTLDLATPPEILLAPGSRDIVAGENADVYFLVRGQRPISFELIESPPGSSFRLEAAQDDEVFNIHVAKSSAVTLADTGRYTIRSSNPVETTMFSFDLNVTESPSNPGFSGKPFQALVKQIDSGFANSSLFDSENDRFLISGSDGFQAIAIDGTVTEIFDEGVLQGLSDLQLLGFLPGQGVVFTAKNDFHDRRSVYAYRNGGVSVLVSSNQLASQLGFIPDFSRSTLQILNGVIVGIFGSSLPSEAWAVVRIDDGISVILASTGFNANFSCSEFLGLDEQSRPLFHQGFQVNPSDATKTLGPLVFRLEANRRPVQLPTGFLPGNEVDVARTVTAIPSNSGVRFLAWGERLIEVFETRLEVHQMNHLKNGNPVFFPELSRAFASEYRVLFPGLTMRDQLPFSAFVELGLSATNSDSVERKIFSWTSSGIEEVFGGRYLDGHRVDAGGSLAILNVVGDQVVVAGSGFVMLNQAIEIESTPLSLRRGRNGLFLDVPIGADLETSESLKDGWMNLPSHSGTFVIPQNFPGAFFRVKSK